MADEGVVGSTVATFERHPIWIVGGVVGLVALIYIFGSKGAQPTQGQNFTFQYGPSDAQVMAGTQQAIAQGAQQTAVTLANINATAKSTAYSDLFQYLTQSTAATDAANTQIAQYNMISTTNGQNDAVYTAQNTNIFGTLSANYIANQQANAAIQIAQINHG